MSTAGFPDSTVRESRDRVRAAIRNAGLEFPIEHVTVNLAPAYEGRLIPFGRLPGAAASRSQPQEHVTSQCLAGHSIT